MPDPSPSLPLARPAACQCAGHWQWAKVMNLGTAPGASLEPECRLRKPLWQQIVNNSIQADADSELEEA